MNDLITVIIPVYRVEQYINRCVDSIINQSYRNLEIILIDDGSPDRCGIICDEYKEIDSRIKVIHRSNGGLSAARNSGLDLMTGKYVVFVDSDDWLAIDTINYLYSLLIQNQADVSAIGLLSVFDDTESINPVYGNKTIVFDKIQALETFLFSGQLSPCACGKLWKAELWNDIRFPEGRLFEDQFTIYKLLDLTEKSVLSNNKMYFYFKRAGSIGHSEFSAKTYDLHYAIQEEYKFIIEKYPEIKSTMIVALITWEIVFVNMMIRSNYSDRKLINEIRKLTRSNINECIQCRYINKTRKVQMILFAYFYHTYVLAYNMYKKTHPFA